MLVLLRDLWRPRLRWRIFSFWAPARRYVLCFGQRPKVSKGQPRSAHRFGTSTRTSQAPVHTSVKLLLNLRPGDRDLLREALQTQASFWRSFTINSVSARHTAMAVAVWCRIQSNTSALEAIIETIWKWPTNGTGFPTTILHLALV